MRKIKSKKSLIALAIIAIVCIVGGTFAYYTSTQQFDNIFKTKTYGTKFEEVFESPDDWIPGTTTTKEVYITNTGEVDMAVRLSYTEDWTTATGSKLNGTQNGNKAALIHLTNTNDWKKVGNYYVYNKKLAVGKRTSTFMDSVTFNSAITADLDCRTTGTDGNTKVCTSTGNGYDGATYRLNITIETIQFDAATSTWGLNNFTWAN